MFMRSSFLRLQGLAKQWNVHLMWDNSLLRGSAAWTGRKSQFIKCHAITKVDTVMQQRMLQKLKPKRNRKAMNCDAQ